VESCFAAGRRTPNTTRAPAASKAAPAWESGRELDEPVTGRPLLPPLVPEAVTVTVVAVVVVPSVTVIV